MDQNNDNDNYNATTIIEDSINFHAHELLVDYSDQVPCRKCIHNDREQKLGKRDVHGNFMKDRIGVIRKEKKLDKLQDDVYDHDSGGESDFNFDDSGQGNGYLKDELNSLDFENSDVQGPSKTKYLKALKEMELDKTRKFKCPECDRYCNGKKARNRHMRERHPTKWEKYRPHMAINISAAKLQAMDEIVKDTESGLYSCVVCNKVFHPTARHLYGKCQNLEADIVAHVEAVHYGMDKAKRIRREANRVDLELPCTICGKIFKRKSHLDRHMKSHSDERPFSCDICGVKFKHSKDIVRHKLENHGDPNCPNFKPTSVKCLAPDCGIVYKRRDNMVAHLKKHHPLLYELEMQNRMERRNKNKVGSRTYNMKMQAAIDGQLIS